MGNVLIPSGHVVVTDGIISNVGSGVPAQASNVPVISKPGHTLLPGLIDGHMHADDGTPVALEQSLNFGVTTICDMHNDHENVVKVKKLAETDPS
ncbi:MAG: hypothetical protein M1828_002781 [Chrysothrix sp. TS-e1954]|nr:MAG: hypothetical protein M1828_002781 [Chrysothrix sp. TS-e1954]